jgi:hypothetical protein
MHAKKTSVLSCCHNPHLCALVTRLLGAWVALLAGVGLWCQEAGAASAVWKVGKPVVTYWAGPPLTDANARQMAEGGWNLVWCGEKELDVARRHGLRAQLQDPLLSPASLEDAGRRQQLDALIERVRRHPALYDYFITDEPNATNFPALGKLVAHLRQRDPAHLAYINLFPTYASNEQLGNSGDKVSAYQAHLDQYVSVVKPGLISYDHYQFMTNSDTPDYFLNLAMIRRTAQAARLPFLNIVQAASWAPTVRVPQADEMRYLVYTTLAYGAQGISYYVYCWPGHTGGIANADGTPTALYATLKGLNREFVAIARELQSLRSTRVFHAGMLPPGAEPLPDQAAFTLDPPLPMADFRASRPVKGAVLGCFGPSGKDKLRETHVLVVNLDYQAETTLGLRGPRRLEVFDATTGKWSRAKSTRATLKLARGGGKLVRVR